MLTLKRNIFKYRDKDGNMQDSDMLFGKNETDTTLTKSGVAADSKVVGETFNQLSEQIGDLDISKVEQSDLETEVENQLDGAKAEIVTELLAQIGGMPVFGTVNDDNTITVTSTLADGNYILMYENDEGMLEQIGSITVGDGEPVITYTNLADPTLTTDTTITTSSEGWLENVRINSSSAITTADGNHITNIIPLGDKDILRIKNMDINGGYGRIYVYTGTTFKHAFVPSSYTDSFVSLSDTYAEITLSAIRDAYATSDITFDSIRVGGTLTGTKEDVIITLDEEII